MKTKLLLITILLLLSLASALAQTPDNDKITVPLSDPNRPAFIRVSLISGSITVKGTSGKDVIVDAKRGEDDESDENNDNDNDEKSDKKKGLRRIPNMSTGVTVEEDDNEVTIGTGGTNAGSSVNLVIEVPVKSSMKLSTINDGDVKVENITGDIEVSDINGSIIMKGINGSVVADALNGEINVVFTGIDTKKSMSFSSMNGDIDVTLPSDTKASLKLKNDQGEIYSDFDLKMNYNSTFDDNAARKGKRKVSMEKMMSAALNGGGGADMLFKNFNGDIYIRKGK